MFWERTGPLECPGVVIAVHISVISEYYTSVPALLSLVRCVLKFNFVESVVVYYRL